MIISGACHYFRTHPAQWATRLHWLRLMGLDTVETYVPWNLHEPGEGEYTFSGGADVGRFLTLAASEGLDVILRPGPYICAEWDNGGLPSWLTARPEIRLRTSDGAYLDAVQRWFGELLPRVAPYQATRGGPVSIVQLENEYGSFGSDTAYLSRLHSLLRDGGIDVPVVTSDGPEDFMLAGGTLPGVAATVNFGSRAAEAFAALRAWRPEDPPFCMEWWNGWFDHWGESRHRRDPGEAAAVLAEILQTGASVNVYVAHGGTNFGVTAGANFDPPEATACGTYQPTATSYDYDAPLDERGAPTAKFHAYREVIARFRPVPPAEEFTEPLLPAGRLNCHGAPVPLSRVLDARSGGGADVASASPLSFERLGLAHGLVRYRARLTGPREARPLVIDGLGDRAHLVIDGGLRHVFDRNDQQPFELEVPGPGLTIDLIVESMGRVNYGRRLGERKGITGAVVHGRQEVHGWTMTPLALPGLPVLPAAPAAGGDPGAAGGDPGGPGAFHVFTFDAERPGDSFIDMSGWGKGYVWVNGFSLGRYWNLGPQLSLYVPRPVVTAGANTVVVLELDRQSAPAPHLSPSPVFTRSPG